MTSIRLRSSVSFLHWFRLIMWQHTKTDVKTFKVTLNLVLKDYRRLKYLYAKDSGRQPSTQRFWSRVCCWYMFISTSTSCGNYGCNFSSFASIPFFILVMMTSNFDSTSFVYISLNCFLTTLCTLSIHTTACLNSTSPLSSINTAIAAAIVRLLRMAGSELKGCWVKP